MNVKRRKSIQKNIAKSVKENCQIRLYCEWETFYTGDVIQHKTFGKGRVQLTFGNQIEAIFPDKERVLLHRPLF